MATQRSMLTPRWTKLIPHPKQVALWKCNKRFIVVPAGRRSGKTERAKRKLVQKALKFYAATDGRFMASAPTHAQAKDIFWDDLKLLTPQKCLYTPAKPWRSISESKLTIKLYNGAKIQVAGMDKPERAEGSPIDGIILDEYGNMKADVWDKHVRPALSTINRPGWAWFIGVPEGRNHYFQLWKNIELPERTDSWAGFTWFTADINPEEAEAAKKELDLLTYQQEYEGSFVSFEGRCYYAFDPELNVTPKNKRLHYDPDLPLILVFDFNSKPGVLGVVQEQKRPDWFPGPNEDVTCGIDEVYVERNSNSKLVCQKLLEKDYIKSHKGKVLLHGDATGGAKGSQSVEGSDWDIIEQVLNPVFGSRLVNMVPRSNPRIRTRVNATNSRFCSADGTRRTVFDRISCPMFIRDFEGVVSDDHGDPDKKKDEMLTHASDAFGYYCAEEHPCITGTGLKRDEL